MVDITPAPGLGRQVIDGYGAGGFRISERRYEGAVLVFPEQTRSWPVNALEGLCAADFEPLRQAAGELDLLILGTGTALRRLPRGLEAEIRAWGLAVEPMDTGAACRTYNVLLLEDRRVVAALLPIA